MKVAPPDEGPAFLVGNGEERITHIGRFLRKTRLDEILQLLNVIRGDMSIIGPRPEMKEFYEEGKKNIPYYRYRTRLRPGITGWAQVNFSYTTNLEDYKKKTEYDLYYIKNRSLLLDLKYFFKVRHKI
jgi:lipopolysaccharide/colanic/teichoic acid biosynthesis glycosyltransferase